MTPAKKPLVGFLAVLTPEEAQEVYRLATTGEMVQKDIARRYGISQATVSNIKQRRFYRKVTGKKVA